MWKNTNQMREDEPDYMLAFTHVEVFEALVAHFNERFPTMAGVKSWRMRYDKDVALIKLWNTPA